MEHDTGAAEPAGAADAPTADAHATDTARTADSACAADTADTARAAAGVGLAAATAPATGDRRVDDALSDLRGLVGAPVAEHPAIFERVHRRLQDVLGELDGRPLAGAQGREPS